MISRIPIRFDPAYALLSRALFLPPSGAYVEISPESVRVRMGWAFRAELPRASIASTSRAHDKPLSRGVHGFAGRWLVNGSGDGILIVDLEPSQRGFVMGFPVRLKQLMISVHDPAALASALRDRA